MSCEKYCVINVKIREHTTQAHWYGLFSAPTLRHPASLTHVTPVRHQIKFKLFIVLKYCYFLMFDCSMLSRQAYNSCWMIAMSAFEVSVAWLYVCIVCTTTSLCNVLTAQLLLAFFRFTSNVQHFLHTYNLFSWFPEFPPSFLFNLVDFSPLIKGNRFDSC